MPGPNFFLKFWREELTSEQVYAAWKHEMKQKKSRETDWLRQMPIFCRGCSDANDKDARKPLKDFPTRSKTNLFHTVIAEGMERFCLACRKSGRIKDIADEKLDEVLADDEIERCETKNSFIQCVECKAELQQTCFDPDKLMRWKKNRHISKHAVCMLDL